ncbi:hypothetical protein [Vibrio phage XZ1]|uniref:Uncharacterized protein n=3 Tax=Schizotequatrovirus TaxID=1198137 RepID=A0A126HGZ5_9CAUD|nr:hypothetical protein CF80_gp288 [Vibrio phage VH7D]YP_009201296.1 hypothetical protein AVU32_gp193 [Vibrio phage ValKK3]ALP47124.1 hypothetical protein phiGrn1_0183 [Vibrio phage phi-Grn1]ALP47508.1 hypothetical protein phiST2_0314 [Vibrio phage phi-ST2]QBX06020.1 hypothetical protein Va3_066 [Vibrio phage Va3]QNJ54645.1 hypothetical protein vBValMR10Z_104 [Vibrio phage vB_ValM_R10Z]QNJ55031.1 hypothetical protein vBValMR11Z_105 [Vibrio phage vB_ValM_R11Z]UOL51421.1 hypothetical protein [
MIYIETSNILSDDTLGFAIAGAPQIDQLEKKERDNVLNKAIEVKLYERLPSTAVLDFLLNQKISFIAVLSKVSVIAEQQRAWFDTLGKQLNVDVMYTDFQEVEHTRDTLLIAEDRHELKLHAQKDGKILPFSTHTQFQFIIDHLKIQVDTKEQ